MEKLKAAFTFLLGNFGPLIVFYLANYFFNLKMAIAASLVFTIAEVLHLRIKKLPLSPFFIFSAITSVVFGIIDLSLPQSILFRYEPSISNIITGVFFIFGAFRKKPLIQEFAEKRKKFENAESPDLVAYFRIFTLLWAAYFFSKAGFYFWLAFQEMSLERMMAIRGTIGSGSLYAMMGLSIFGGKKLFLLLKRMQYLPAATTKEALSS